MNKEPNCPGTRRAAPQCGAAADFPPTHRAPSHLLPLNPYEVRFGGKSLSQKSVFATIIGVNSDILH